MKSFEEVLGDIAKLQGIELSSLSGSAKKITISKLDYTEKRIELLVEGGDTDSRSFDEIHKIYNALKTGKFVHVESVLLGSGSSRNRPETILASLPYIDWGQNDGKKSLIFRDHDTHKLGTNNKLTAEEIKSLNEAMQNMMLSFQSGFESAYPRNRIIFGAPGTGKSHTLNKEVKELIKHGGNYERVTFHPDYSYANFVGTYKPVPYIREDGQKGITYEYVPGPFSRVLVAALKNIISADEAQPYVLIVEEINRANMAAVFGDVFQLLDRDCSNVSEYPIHTSEDMKKYLAKELGGCEESYTEIKIPDNMFIWATMNSADQGVFPMDTAFKRRWDFTYLGVNANEAEIMQAVLTMGEGNYARSVVWNALRKAINNELLNFGVNEDKLMGTFFISKNVIDTIAADKGKEFRRVFKNKVLMYLFDDAAKRKSTQLFNGCSNSKLYSEIVKEFDTKGVAIFMDDIKNEFKDIPSDSSEADEK